ncbi:MAG: hypothetical protein K0S45_2844 [Nitrospira sp.]|jgi:cellulose synthase/poly-beta-1,6-N-acetylglucosamine synthase-like glycosyltransferase|nr:hypothetical protein [Nitrospira sp.]
MAIRWEIFVTWAALACTATASTLFLKGSIVLAEAELLNAHQGSLLEIGTYLMLVGFLVYGNFGYQLARLGYLKRLSRHRPAAISQLRKFAQSAPELTILVPSYKEEIAVIRQTLLSAALQQYPNKRVVLLLDDPPKARTDQDRSILCAARLLPTELHCMFEGPAAYFREALLQFKNRQNNQSSDATYEQVHLAAAYEKAAQCYAMIANTCHDNTHSDDWFKKKILEEPQRALQQRAEELLRLGTVAIEGVTVSDTEAEYQYLAGLFRVELSVFERKRYCNLSNEPNKAMNLNSYLGIMGKHLKELHRPDGCHLVETVPSESTMSVPNTPYVITLDADSLLLPDYALKLVHHIEQPGNERLAVVQTPYSAIPNAPNAMERTAGATTDIQYFIHQGFTYFSATFWVGANALLRKAALDDIVILREHGNGKIPCYIQDATVIEDTESTVDLIAKGWRLFNYPARMAYSATPSDFGSLLIQRGRWANGGLLIVPKLLKYLWKAPKNFRTLNEAFYRFHYLTSLAGAPLSVLLLMTVPFSSTLTSVWLPLTALPYFLLYGRDLSLMGYDGCRDLLRVYALNLLLIPIHLSGALKSLRQKFNGQKSAFQRTPKVSGRTRAPRIYIGLEYALIIFLLAFAAMDGLSGRWIAGLFATLNAGLLLYAIHRFIGFPESIDDFTFRVARQSHGLGALLHSETTLVGGAPTDVVVANTNVPLTGND